MIRLRRSALILFMSLAPTLAAAQARTPEPPPPDIPRPSDIPRPAPMAPLPDPRPVLNLSLEEAVRRAMANNIDIAVERFNPQGSELAVSELRGFYQPFLTSTVGHNSSDTPAQTALSGAPVESRDTFTYDLGAQHSLRTGGSLRLDFLNDRATTNSTFQSFNPSFGSSFTGALAQPLLRDLRVDSRRYQIKVAKKNREISDVAFRQTVVNTVANVKDRYYDLLYAIDNLEAQRKSLSLAVDLVEQNRTKVRVGTLAQLDVVSAESEQASREESVLVAVQALADAEDALRRAIYPDNDPATWASRIVPTDRPTAEPVAVDAAAAAARALANRTDIVTARKQLENSEYAIRYARNQLLPALDLVASYGASGVGGTQLVRDNSKGFGGPIIETIPGGYSDVVGDVFRDRFPTWNVAMSFSYPILNRQAGAARAHATVSRDQSLMALTRLEMQITAEVRTAARAVETNYQRIETTGAARVLQERRLDTETKKFAAGMSTNFLVTQIQRDLVLAEVARLRAIADYRKSLVEWERVQEAGLGGTGSSATVSVQ
jgi:HAE1 family hydrophobic/amphiphilic exporter-1